MQRIVIWKRWFAITIISVVALCIQAAPTQAAYWDNIDQYNVDLAIRPDGVVAVHEEITYNFGTVAPAHGIERFLPRHYSYGPFTDALNIDLQRVTDADGQPWPVDTYRSGPNLVWRIGSEAVTVTGKQTYILDYTVDWVLTDYENYVELYWNVIGTEWTVPISEANIQVTVPFDSQLADYPPICYYGSYAEDNTCTFTQTGNTFQATIHNLGAYQGVTALVAVKPEAVAMPNTVEILLHAIWANWSLLFLPLWLVLGVVLRVLHRRIKSDKPLIPIYEVPAGIRTPAQAEYILTGKVTQRSFAAEMIEAARLGELELIYDEKKGEVKTLRATGKTNRTDAASVLLRNQLFANKYAAGKETELKKTVVTSSGFLSTAKKAADQHYEAQHWIDPFKKMMKLACGAYGLVGFVVGGLLLAIGNESGIQHFVITGGVILGAGILMFVILGSHLPLNVAGANTRQLVDGFKWFLGVTETERLKFSQVPKLTPKLFEDYLPYAIVFGVEKQWVKQFEGILQDPPTWLHGVNNALLYNALISTGRTPAQFKVPVSARSGGSGFSGGGFSGGGFGGGGGGRW